MFDIYLYLVLCGVLTLLLWTPYILARLFVWGLPTFLHNYPDNFPAQRPQQPLWAERAQRAHLNMVETLPAFVAVVIGSTYFVANANSAITDIAIWCAVFFWARLAHATVYILGLPYLRTPTYLLSWFATLAIARHAFI